MAKPNYSYAKRQKELAKKAKKEEKKRLKAEAALNPDTEETGAEESGEQIVEEGVQIAEEHASELTEDKPTES